MRQIATWILNHNKISKIKLKHIIFYLFLFDDISKVRILCNARKAFASTNNVVMNFVKEWRDILIKYNFLIAWLNNYIFKLVTPLQKFIENKMPCAILLL